MNERDRQILIRLRGEVRLVSQMLDGFELQAFLADERTKRAVCMTLINIGELVKNLSDEFRMAHNHIPWRAISGLRDITAHKYQTLRMEDVWLTATRDIPQLKKELDTI
ncbi:MAG: DUF86 domain-containing protein [Methanocorpusculum sp.]|nr:DUF86 domain-containing protein [Methanocorpusculum sp.]